MITDSDNFLAKSNGVTFKDHSILVSKFARVIAENCYCKKDDSLFSEIECAGLCHDIAKLIDDNQVRIKKKKKLNNKPFRHNEVGWAFLSKHLNTTNQLSKDNELSKGRILHAIYWHHGIENEMGKNTDTEIYDLISPDDLFILKQKLTELLKLIEGYTCSEEPIDDLYGNGYVNSPNFYLKTDSNSNNELRTFIRMCLITADRIVSAFTPEEVSKYFISEIVVNTDKILQYITELEKIKYVDQLKKIHFDNHRFEIQKEIIDRLEKTIIYNATAGFGKTVTGLLSILRNGKKTIWVCPRNTVAESVYLAIESTLKYFGIHGISIELFLSSSVKESNTHNFKGFDSDIIITNIDNFLAPTFKNDIADRLILTMSSNVIFDEYHEYVVTNKHALFACFVNLMRTRHRFTNSKTLLLSATPIQGIEIKWNDFSTKSIYLPSITTHYPASHNKPYKLNIVNNPVVKKDSSSIIFNNSITSAQEYKRSNDHTFIYHSEFESDKKSEKLKSIFNTYGKESVRSNDKQNVVATNALQASADISYASSINSSISPMGLIQQIGRVNRWGDYNHVCEINIFNSDDQSEKSMKPILYTYKLSDLWFAYIKQFDGKMLTLDELYVMYNDFHQKHNLEIQNYINLCYNTSLDYLVKIYPIQIDVEKEDEKEKVLISGSNKIRATGNEIFCIYRKKDSEEFTEVFNVTLYAKDNFQKQFHEPSNICSRINKSMKHLIRTKDTRYDYSELHDCTDLAIIRKAARKSNTPYICFDQIYDEELGLVPNPDLKKS